MLRAYTIAQAINIGINTFVKLWRLLIFEECIALCDNEVDKQQDMIDHMIVLILLILFHMVSPFLSKSGNNKIA